MKKSKIGVGIVASFMYFKVKEFEKDLYELENNPDFTLVGTFATTEAADEELEYQGFTLEQINRMNLAPYGNVLEVIQSPVTDEYYVFIGAR